MRPKKSELWYPQPTGPKKKRKTAESSLPWAPKKSPEPPAFSELPLIFSGPHSNQLWDAIGVLGDGMTADDVHNAIYQIACSMQALEARLVTALKRTQRAAKKSTWRA